MADIPLHYTVLHIMYCMKIQCLHEVSSGTTQRPHGWTNGLTRAICQLHRDGTRFRPQLPFSARCDTELLSLNAACPGTAGGRRCELRIVPAMH